MVVRWVWLCGCIYSCMFMCICQAAFVLLWTRSGDNTERDVQWRTKEFFADITLLHMCHCIYYYRNNHRRRRRHNIWCAYKWIEKCKTRHIFAPCHHSLYGLFDTLKWINEHNVRCIETKFKCYDYLFCPSISLSLSYSLVHLPSVIQLNQTRWKCRRGRKNVHLRLAFSTLRVKL